MISVEAQVEVWLGSKVWITKDPKKSRIFVWLALKNRVLTWELMRKRGKHDPSICYLCRGAYVEQLIGIPKFK